MDKISINVLHNSDGYCVELCVMPKSGNGMKPIYKGIMTLEEFGKCIASIQFCEINTISK